MPYARATGRLVNSPKKREARPAMAAVAVIKSLRTSIITQKMIVQMTRAGRIKAVSYLLCSLHNPG
jgi:hypothetical protein